jgi:hypothetical protein
MIRVFCDVSASEIASTIAALKADSIMLSRAMQRADRISKLINMGGEGFKDLMKQAKSSKGDIDSYSKPRQRWIVAIKKVLLQNAVAKIKLQVERFEETERQLAELQRQSARINNVNDALLSAIQVAEERTVTGVNQLSPRLAPLEKQTSNSIANPAAGGAANGAAAAANAKSSKVELPKLAQNSTRTRRQTADSGTAGASVKNSARGAGTGTGAGAAAAAQPLQPLNLNVGGGVAAVTAAAAGALSSLTSAVEGALGKSKQTQSTEDMGGAAAKSARSGKSTSRRRSTLESKIAPSASMDSKDSKDSKEGASARIAKSTKKNSARFKEEEGAGENGEPTEELSDADCMDGSVQPAAAVPVSAVTRLRRVTEAANEQQDNSNLSNNGDNSTGDVTGDLLKPSAVVTAPSSLMDSNKDTA